MKPYIQHFEGESWLPFRRDTFWKITKKIGMANYGKDGGFRFRRATLFTGLVDFENSGFSRY